MPQGRPYASVSRASSVAMTEPAAHAVVDRAVHSQEEVVIAEQSGSPRCSIACGGKSGAPGRRRALGARAVGLRLNEAADVLSDAAVKRRA